MSNSETHYILVVHGTWSAPTSDTSWYQRGGVFVEALEQKLQGTELSGAVWRCCAGEPTDFHWSGENTHEARLAAAEQLCRRMLKIRNFDPAARIHLVAHSHGGNVVLKALELYRAAVSEFGFHFMSRIDWGPFRAGNFESERIAAELSKCFPGWSQAVRGASALQISGILAKSWSELDRRGFDAIRIKIDVWRWFSDDPQSLRIGHLVFLGTPFLHKRWYRHAWRRLLRVAIGALSTAAVYCVAVLFASMILDQLSLANFVGVNPVHWPVWIQLGLAFFLLTAAISSGGETNQPRDINFYHYVYDSPRESAPFKALVVTAAQLDEALLGLSTEALGDAYLTPKLEKLKIFDTTWQLSAEATGAGDPRTTGGIHKIGTHTIALLILYVLNGFRLLARTLLFPLRPILKEYVRRSIRALVLSQATGLHPREFDGAAISIQSNIGVPEIFDETVWDIAELAASVPSFLAVPADKERYRFLWSSDALAARITTSKTWSLIESHRRHIERERGFDISAEERLALQRTCLVIEERARELSGAVQLSHSGYYGHPEMLEAMAAFLVHGRHPAR